MMLRIRIKRTEQPTPVPAARPSFAELQPRSPHRVFYFLSSLGLHLAVVWLLASTVQAVKARMVLVHEEYPYRALQMAPILEAFRPRLTDPRGQGKSGQTRPARRSSGLSATPVGKAAPSPAAAPADSGSAGDQAPPAPRQEKRFQLPAVAVQKRARQVLVRIDVPPDLKLDPKTAVPQILLWQLPPPMKPRDTLVAAAHREEEPVRERETPSVKPQLIDRNREQKLAELRHAAEPTVAVPAIPLPVANTTPIRLLDGIPGDRLPNSTGPVVHSPEEVHVISVPDLPVPQARVIPLPLGNQGTLPPSPDGANAGGGSGRGASGEGAQAGAASDSQRRGTGAGGDGAAKSGQASSQPGGRGSTGAGSGNGNGRSGSLDARAGNGDAPSGRGPSGAAGESAGGANGGTGPAPPNATLIVRPRDGKYSVVVLGSSNLDAYPEVAGLLSGKLVYTVYIRTGARKEWILQYCLPKSAEQAVKVRGSAVPIEAPYPFVIYRPNLTLLNDPDYLIVHGFINAAGKFEHLTALGDIDSDSRKLLIAALDHWEFRPASRDGIPNTVEIALIIPREPT